MHENDRSLGKDNLNDSVKMDIKSYEECWTRSFYITQENISKKSTYFEVQFRIVTWTLYKFSSYRQSNILYSERDQKQIFQNDIIMILVIPIYNFHPRSSLSLRNFSNSVHMSENLLTAQYLSARL